MRVVLPAALGIAAFAPAACGSSTHAPAMTRAQARRAFLAAVAPADAAARAVPRNFEVAPALRALAKLREKLLRIAAAYPPAAADLRRLANAGAGTYADCLRAKTAKRGAARSLGARYTSDLSAAAAAEVEVRLDLGLPPSTR